jgi:hypothetical protein
VLSRLQDGFKGRVEQALVEKAQQSIRQCGNLFDLEMWSGEDEIY